MVPGQGTRQAVALLAFKRRARGGAEDRDRHAVDRFGGQICGDGLNGVVTWCDDDLAAEV